MFEKTIKRIETFDPMIRERHDFLTKTLIENPNLLRFGFNTLTFWENSYNYYVKTNDGFVEFLFDKWRERITKITYNIDKVEYVFNLFEETDKIYVFLSTNSEKKYTVRFNSETTDEEYYNFDGLNSLQLSIVYDFDKLDEIYINFYKKYKEDLSNHANIINNIIENIDDKLEEE